MVIDEVVRSWCSFGVALCPEGGHGGVAVKELHWWPDNVVHAGHADVRANSSPERCWRPCNVMPYYNVSECAGALYSEIPVLH